MKKRDIFLIILFPIVIYLAFLIYDIRTPKINTIKKQYTFTFSTPKKVVQAFTTMVIPHGTIKRRKSFQKTIADFKNKQTKIDLKKIGPNKFSITLPVKEYSYRLLPKKEEKKEIDIYIIMYFDGYKRSGFGKLTLLPEKSQYSLNKIQIDDIKREESNSQ